MIQFQTLIFVIFANRTNVRVVRKILEIWCTCNILVKPCIISSFLTLFALLSLPVSEHSIYLCSNSFELPKFLYVFAYYLGSCCLLFFLLSRPVSILLVFCFCTFFFCLTFCVLCLFQFSHLVDSKAL